MARSTSGSGSGSGGESRGLAALLGVAEAGRERRVAHAVAADVFHAARYPADACVKLALHHGGCHCGRVKVTIRAPTALRAVDCSTSMSTKKGRFPYVFVDASGLSPRQRWRLSIRVHARDSHGQTPFLLGVRGARVCVSTGALLRRAASL